jgi:aspartyl-tRNA(Asn)/glutamyl-tRNA(Gln) amidotransferase subunit C
MAVSISEARHVARLASLALTEEELATLASELSVVLEHFEGLAEFAGEPGDVSGEFAGDAAVTLGSRQGRVDELRPDTVGAALGTDEALRNAPSSEDGQFSVPGFLPDEP